MQNLHTKSDQKIEPGGKPGFGAVVNSLSSVEPPPNICVQVGPKTDLMFFDTDGTRTIDTHPGNKRNQKAKERRFCKGIICRGLSQAVRGDPIMIYNGDRKLPHLAITFGSLSNAFYAAVKLAPTCKNVIHAREQGLEV